MIKVLMSISKRRLENVFILCLIWTFLIVIRLAELQIFKHKEFKSKVLSQNQRVVEVNSKRGSIFDRNERILGESIETDSVYIIPSQIEDLNRVISILRNTLEISKDQERSIYEKIKQGKPFIWVKRKFQSERIYELKNMKLRGVGVLKEYKRIYPNDNLASHVLGGVGVDEQGLDGVEKEYDRHVLGKPGKMILYLDALQKEYLVSLMDEPEEGRDLYLTIDEVIQFILEKELKEGVNRFRAKEGIAIAMNPYSGEILGLANFPDYNPNNYSQTDSRFIRNRAIQKVFEPGSTFKIITACAALEERLVKPTDEFDCRGGGIELSGIFIRDHKNFSILSFSEILKYSSNSGIIQVGSLLGKENFFRYIKNVFQFGEKTGIDLPGEERGILRDISKWSNISLGEISMGQEIGVTAIQMIRAFSSIANGGYLVKPRIVKKISGWNSEELIKSDSSKKILTDYTVNIMKGILEKIPEDGTGTLASLKGFRVAGKTGTAQKIGEDGKYSTENFISSFIGYVPAENPIFSLIVVIDEPEGEHYGGKVSAPIFRSMTEKILMYLGVFSNSQERINIHLVSLRRSYEN
ncbi:MAG: penicillin-binding transpeptidase domain-containing protein [Acidobacteriota bacterium]